MTVATQKYDQREQNAASQAHGPPVMSFAYIFDIPSMQTIVAAKNL